MEDINENTRNVYIVRRKLAELKLWNESLYRYFVGNFEVQIFPREIQDIRPNEKLADNLLKYKTVNITLWENSKSGDNKIVRLLDDPRFKNYEPIQYNIHHTPSGKLNFSNGDNMPITHLCELIKYLHRLSNLTAFA